MLTSQLETPALIVDLEAFERNLQRMRSFVESRGLRLRPHYKSHKSTAIAHMQVRAGAKGLCCAKVSEAQDLALAGIEDVLIANEVVSPAKIALAASLANCCRLTVCVDSAQNVEDLSAAAVVQNATIHCLVEYDLGMHRCGLSTHEEVVQLAKRVDAAPNLVYEGIQAYAGHIAHERDFESRKRASAEIESDLQQLRARLVESGLSPKEVSGVSTGTAYFRPEQSTYTELQAGSYIFMDASYGALGLDFEQSLFLLTSVISLNEEYAVCDAGAKSLGMDQDPPYFREYPDLPGRFNEEHSSLPRANTDLTVGDRLHLVPGHCCTTVNLHDFIFLAKEGKVVDRVPVTSRGKSF